MKYQEVSPKSDPPTLPLSVLNVTLKANCLLTRRPLCFLTPTRSLFFYKNPWQWITSLLYEHGYKVEILQLPFQNTELKKTILKNNLQFLQKKHLVMDSVTYLSLKNDLTAVTESTITIISSDNLGDGSDEYLFHVHSDSPTPLSYRLHRLWCQILGLKTAPYCENLNQISKESWHLFLDHCVKLAEIDYELE